MKSQEEAEDMKVGAGLVGREFRGKEELKDLLERAEEDGDEVSKISVFCCEKLLSNSVYSRMPDFSLTPDGEIYVQWSLRGKVALRFKKDGVVRMVLSEV